MTSYLLAFFDMENEYELIMFVVVEITSKYAFLE